MAIKKKTVKARTVTQEKATLLANTPGIGAMTAEQVEALELSYSGTTKRAARASIVKDKRDAAKVARMEARYAKWRADGSPPNEITEGAGVLGFTSPAPDMEAPL